MPQLNRDLLREVFYELAKENGFNKDIDNFMMAGKEPFKLVLDICKKANKIVIFKGGVFAGLPGIKSEFDYEEYESGTKISTKMILFKPISIALASTITSLEIKSFSTDLIPMLKSIDRELEEINVQCENLKAICQACSNIPNLQDGFNIKVRKNDNFYGEMKTFSFPCQKLRIRDVDFNEICHLKFDNSHLRKNIRDLTINGRFDKTEKFHKELKKFAAFLSTNFPNLEKVDIRFFCSNTSYTWDWNDDTMASCFQGLPFRIKGCIYFEQSVKRDYEVDLVQYPDVRKYIVFDGYYKIFSITSTLSFRLTSLASYRSTTFWSATRDFNYTNLTPLPLVEQPKKVKFDKKNHSTKSAPACKHQRTFKPIQNRFSR